MKIRAITLWLSLSLGTLGCGAKAVDLDGPIIESSSEPGVLAVVRERVEKIAVDEQRLYWIGTQLPRAYPKNVWFLRSCQKQACATTLITYDEQATRGVDGTSIFSVKDGQIYWFNLTSRELLACPVSGCDGPPRRVASGLDFSGAAFADDRFLFADGESIESVPLQADSRVRDAYSPLMSATIAIRGNYVYWLATRTDIGRARTDGSSGVETVTSDVRVADEPAFGLTTDASAIYWTDNLLSGSIKRCPLAGCTVAPEKVIGPLRAPQSLLIDGSELYYEYETKPYEYALASCSLPTCASAPPLIEHVDAPGVLALDDQYLYVATTEQDVSPDNFAVDTIAQIRRLPKPKRELP